MCVFFYHILYIPSLRIFCFTQKDTFGTIEYSQYVHFHMLIWIPYYPLYEGSTIFLMYWVLYLSWNQYFYVQFFTFSYYRSQYFYFFPVFFLAFMLSISWYMLARQSIHYSLHTDALVHLPSTVPDCRSIQLLHDHFCTSLLTHSFILKHLRYLTVRTARGCASQPHHHYLLPVLHCTW